MLRTLIYVCLLTGLLGSLSACVNAPLEPVAAEGSGAASASPAAKPSSAAPISTPAPTEIVVVQTSAPPASTMVPALPSPTPAPVIDTPSVDSSIRQTAWASVLANDAGLSASDWFGQTRYEVKASGGQASGIPILDQILYVDMDGDGAEEAVIPLASGGTAGDIGFLVYRGTAPTPTMAAWQMSAGTKQWLELQQGKLVASDAIYGKGEGNCCPSGRRYVTYILQGTELKAIAERTAGHPGAEPFMVLRFYEMINGHDLTAAYAMLSDAYQQANPFDTWAAGYASTVSVEANATAGGTPGVVEVALTATDAQADGQQRVQRFTGTWNVQWDGGRNQWVLDAPQIVSAP